MRKYTIIFLGIFILCTVIQPLHSSLSQTKQPELEKAVVKVKYIRAPDAFEVLRTYLSPRGEIQVINRENRLVIEDIPVVLEKLLSILKEIDVKPVDLQFNIELILGSKISDKKTGLDKEMKSDPVMKELRSLLKYKSFVVLDSSIMKVQDNNLSYQRMGGEGINLRLRLRPRYIKEEKGDNFQVELRLEQSLAFDEGREEKLLILIDTTLTLKSGERTVVGVSKLNGGDKALILIVSGKVLK